MDDIKDDKIPRCTDSDNVTISNFSSLKGS